MFFQYYPTSSRLHLDIFLFSHTALYIRLLTQVGNLNNSDTEKFFRNQAGFLDLDFLSQSIFSDIKINDEITFRRKEASEG
jgi:hypothetical protein